MKLNFHSKFIEMDALSSAGTPFFFMADFLMQNVEIYKENELEKSGLFIDFEGFKNNVEKDEICREFSWKTFPETLENYKKGFEIVQKNLKAGNSYLINYTQKTKIETDLSLSEIFQFSKAKYKILYQDKFVCFSPETFVKMIDNKVFTYPMKGTIDANIENAKDLLKNDVKEKAEHYTVVDLLRNDLSMVADEVQVDEFQRIDFIETKQKNLYAMSSKISGEVKEEYKGKVGSLLQKLLPAGSILGAPKPKTLEVILEAENYNRGWYTGVCGWFDGRNLDTCVMIRFIEKDGDDLYFKSGGGITHLSRLEDEYEEMKNKIYVPIY